MQEMAAITEEKVTDTQIVQAKIKTYDTFYKELKQKA